MSRSRGGEWDEARALVDAANELISAPLFTDASVDGWLERLDRADDLTFVRFDLASRTQWTNDGIHDLAPLLSTHRNLFHRRTDTGPRRRLWLSLALCAWDGHERELAVRTVPLRRGSLGVILIRCVEWVGPVRDAALARVSEATRADLISLLRLCDGLSRMRERAEPLAALLEVLLDEPTIRQGLDGYTWSERRIAWRRLAALGAVRADDVRDRLLPAADEQLRSIAAERLAVLPDEEQIAVAQRLLDDPVARISRAALTALIDRLDERSAIEQGLCSRGPARTRAQALARLTGLDARAFYRERLRRDPDHHIALLGLLQIADRSDLEVVLERLDDPRRAVRITALRALTRIDLPSARCRAIELFHAGGSGRETRAAGRVFEGHTLTTSEIRAMESIAMDPARPPDQRRRALTAMGSSRWVHLRAVLLLRQPPASSALRATADQHLRAWTSRSATLTSAPDEALRAELQSLVGTIEDPRVRRTIDFVLRTGR